MGTSSAHAKALPVNPLVSSIKLARCFLAAGVLGLASLATGLALAATPPSTVITNTATASYGVAGTPITVSGSVSITTAARTPATITFMQYAPSAPGISTPLNVPVSECNAGSGFAPLPAPVPAGGSALTVPAILPLAPATRYASGDPVFLRVVDFDQNQNSLVAETILVTVSTNGADSESLRLTETGPSTGVFVGYVPSASGTAQPGNCSLNVTANTILRAKYIDRAAGSIDADADALIDPLGLVFDSKTGLAVNGARITMMNAATGLPADVFGNDGVSKYPSSVISGDTVTDAGGMVYIMGPGRYQFPRVRGGTYYFKIEPPGTYAAPSIVSTAVLQTLRSTPYFIVPGSRGDKFDVIADALDIDIPLDPPSTYGVKITKSAGKATVAVGEFVPYSVTITNGSATPIPNLRLADRLPVGFRYQAGSARLDTAVLADPIISADGRGQEYNLGSLAGSATVTLRYVAAVNPGAQIGPAENTAQTIGTTISNTAKASVLVREDLNRSTAILIGRVTLVDTCERKDDYDDYRQDPSNAGLLSHTGSTPLGLKGVRVLMQDGTYIITDAEGRWHADNIRPGTHVVQLDETSLPKGYELQACDQNTRTGGRNFSQFVNVRGGTLWRTDFRFIKVASCLKEQIQIQGKTVQVALAAQVANQGVSATVMLPNGAKVVADSVKLNGQPFTADGGDGYLVVRLGAQPDKWRQVLSFELEQAPTADLTLQVRIQPIDQPAQGLLPLTLKAPALEAAQCAPIALPEAVKAPATDVAPAAAAAAAKAAAAAAAAAAEKATAPAAEQLIEQLPFDDKWIAAAGPGAEWLHPQTGFVPALPVIKVAIKHDAKHLVELKVNGVAVNVMRFEGITMNPAGTLALSNWRSVDLRDGTNQLEVTVRDAQGETVLNEVRAIHYAVGPASAVFDLTRSKLVADGRTSPVIAVRMLDKEGHPVRRGVGGELQIGAPYLSQDQANAIQREQLTGNVGGKARYQIGEDGIALIALQPTTQAGEVVLKFAFGNATNTPHEVRTWLTPEMREWVLVGFAEGTAGFKALSGGMETLSASGADDKLFDQNRVAFYGKGQIKGDYLMTIAYDSAKTKNSAGSKVLNQAVDPNQFYTLYADATQPQFDAASLSKLYLKIEKSQFYALFGDFDTGLSITELGRYSRTINGVKSEFKGDRFAYSAFATQTTQSFRKDEIQGDGTSGLYRLASRDVVVNSDKVRIEVRDRFRPEIIVNARFLTRYLDYQIDPALGTLFFNQPINARDENFNPVFIVAEYESGSPTDAKLSYGGRVATKVSDKAVVGLTHINEGNVGREATLTAADTQIKLGEKTTVRAEVATSQRNALVGPESGNASLIELKHDDGQLAARAYARQQDSGFGLGQQAAAGAGTKKMGGDLQLKLSDNLQIKGEAFTQENLVNHAQLNVGEVRGQWREGDLNLSAGLRTANEVDPTGKTAAVRQLVAGVGYDLLDKRLTLRASTELDIGSNGTSLTYPNRLILGGDYKVTTDTTVFTQHEMARIADLQVNTTRLGLRSRVWEGGELASSLGNQANTDGGRLFSNMGLVQRWKINDEWATDFGLDRSQTISGTATANPFSAAQPLASGTPPSTAVSQTSVAGTNNSVTLLTGDYTAVYAGVAYRTSLWSSNVRLERRIADTDSKTNLLLGAQRNLERGRTMAAGLNFTRVDGTLNSSLLNARLSYAHRPLNSTLIWLDRFEYVEESRQDLSGVIQTRKMINNFNANWLPQRGTQVAIQYGLKYVVDTIDSAIYTGITDLVGLEARQDIGERMDIGLHAGSLRSFKTSVRDYQLGVSVGMRVADNSWLSVGLNQRGFYDPDFSDAAYRAQGMYLNLRVKFDEKTFNLNDRNQGLSPTKP